MRIDQFVPGFAKHDAIGNHTLRIRAALRSAGFESDIFGEFIDPRLSEEARLYTDGPAASPDQLLLYHSSTHSPMAAWLQERVGQGQTLLADYHNITPSSYFQRWEPAAARSMDLAREELIALAPHTSLAMADSAFNAAELDSAGYANTAVCPLLVDLEEYHAEPSARTLSRLRRRRDSGGPQWLFVGRVAPNKCQHDVIAAFAIYRRHFEPRARLSLIGGATSVRYRRALDQMVAELDLGESVEILENVEFRDLLAYFAVADVFVCMSEHEGFCVPVLEAMELGVPVVAYAAAAIPETLASSGVLLSDKDPLAVADAVHSAIDVPAERDALVVAGKRRAADFSLRFTSERMVTTITDWINANE